MYNIPYEHAHVLGSSNNSKKAEYYSNNKYELEQWLNLIVYNYRLP